MGFAMFIDLRVLELLSSKICHDLISPVSAINNGVELIEDIGGDVVDEAMKLIGNSAVQSSRRLKVFRIAYGRAGSEANLPLRDLRLVAEQYFEGGKIKFSWPEQVGGAFLAERRGALKTLINMLVLSEEVLAYGGNISLTESSNAEQPSCTILIEGRGAALSPAFEEALTQKTQVEDITPRTIQPYITGCFAANFGLKISHESPAEDRLSFTLSSGNSEYDASQSE